MILFKHFTVFLESLDIFSLIHRKLTLLVTILLHILQFQPSYLIKSLRISIIAILPLHLMASTIILLLS